MIVVGRDRGDPLIEASEEYLRRVARTLPAETVELKEVPLRKNASAETVMAAEAKRILDVLGPRDRVIALDKGGRMMTSEELAERIDTLRQSSFPALSLVIGGPSGLHRTVLERADERWSLSKMTFPHRLARLVLSEQLYRATSILRGEPYHK
ncbi:MAG: 23S rRNA (pseudouridine(1915)-N(3))-methyltransferase RlmH [Myxococcota bacterium]